MLVESAEGLDELLDNLGYDQYLRSDPYLVYKNDITLDFRIGRMTYFGMSALSADAILEQRQQHGDFYVQSPEDEVIHLSLHCLLNKREFSDRYRERIQYLLQVGNEDEVKERLVDNIGHIGKELFVLLYKKHYSEALAMKTHVFLSIFSPRHLYEHMKYISKKNIRF